MLRVQRYSTKPCDGFSKILAVVTGSNKTNILLFYTLWVFKNNKNMNSMLNNNVALEYSLKQIIKAEQIINYLTISLM